MQKLFTVSFISSLLLLAGCAQESAPLPAGTADADQADQADMVPAAAGAKLVGDPDAGQRIYIYCQSCHNINDGGPNKVGPNLYGIFGAPAAQVTGFGYSDALTSSGIVWDAEALEEWVISPSGMVPGTTMLFAGIRDAQQRADLIAYIKKMGPQ